jgi:hypothetical protein
VLGHDSVPGLLRTCWKLAAQPDMAVLTERARPR